MITKLQIRDIFLDFAAGHKQIGLSDYAVNHLWEVDKDLKSNGVVMWVNSILGSIAGDRGEISKLNYQIFLMDVVNIEKDNSDQIESDTYSIGLDMLSHLEFFQFKAKNGVGNFVLDKTATTVEPFREDFKSLYCGNMFSITLDVAFNYNTCIIPDG